MFIEVLIHCQHIMFCNISIVAFDTADISVKDEKFTFNFIDNSIEVYDFQSKIRKNLMVTKANSVERMVKAIHKTSQANDLETIIKVYDRYLV